MTRKHTQFLLLRLGSHHVGLPLAGLVGVTDIGEVHAVPVHADACRGVTVSRGRLVPVVSLGALIGMSTEPGAGGLGVLLDLGGLPLCLEVDDAVAIVTGEALPVPPGAALPWAQGVVKRAEGAVPIIDSATLKERLTNVEVQRGNG